MKRIRFVIQVLSYFATLRKKNITILVATTGDTGPASLQGVIDCNNPYLTIIVYYPNDQISSFQRKQLTTACCCSNGSVARVVTFEGGGDDMDRPIKNILNQQRKKRNDDNNNHSITGINSYNIGRPLFQMVYHIWTYLRIMENLNIEPGNLDYPVDIVIPTGAMGNLVGGFMTKCMGLPIRKFCAGVNINDITYRVMNTGKMVVNPNMYKTLSEALNIQLPYNFERILYYTTNGDHHLVKEFMKELEKNRQLDLSKNKEELFQKLQRNFSCERVTDEEVCSTIRHLLTTCKYYSDPHTAVAFCAAIKSGYSLLSDKESSNNNDNHPIVGLLATASPCKFEEAVTEALGQDGWKLYESNDELFPAKAKQIQEKPESDPIIFQYEVPGSNQSQSTVSSSSSSDATLEEVQMEWERKSMEIIHGLRQKNNENSKHALL